MFRHILLCLLFLTLNLQLEGKSSFDYSNYKATYTNTKLLMTKVPCTKRGESSVYITRSGITFTMVDVFKRGDYTGRMENTEFYGVNSAVLVQWGQLKMSLGSITSLEKGANAIVATNNGIASLSGTNIKTTGDLSRGFQANYGGEIFGSSLSISTEGKSSAALATDKGEGKVSCSSCTLSTKDVGSPLIYSTGNIQITSTKGTASKAQAIVIEGKNNV